MIGIKVLKITAIPINKHGKPLGFFGRLWRKTWNLAFDLRDWFIHSLAAPCVGLLTASLTTQGGFDGFDRGQKLVWVQFLVKATGNYPANGDTLDLSVVAPPGCGQVPVPGTVAIQSNPLSGSVHSGFQYAYLQGTNQKNGKMQVLQSNGTNLVDIGASNPYPAAVSGDNIVGTCAFVYGA